MLKLAKTQQIIITELILKRVSVHSRKLAVTVYEAVLAIDFRMVDLCVKTFMIVTFLI